MVGSVPPLIEPPKSVVGLGTRELVILLIAAAPIFAIWFLQVDPVIKIGVTAFLGGMALLFAFGRESKSGKTFEMYLFQVIQFYFRTRFHIRGADELDLTRNAGSKYGPYTYDLDQPGTRKVLFTVNALPLSGFSILMVVSLAFLAALLTWTWTGGLEEFFYYYRP